jgi:iron complex transport system ATP-binding protein
MLRAENVSGGYGTLKILENIHFAADPGDFIGILGPNGSGKTTLLRLLTRVLPPWKGNIVFGGKNIWRIAPKEFARTFAVVAQTVSAMAMTVEEFVLLGRIPHYRDFQFIENATDVELVEHSMAITGVNGLRDRRLDQISGGERQMAAIARALAQETPWLVLDEPTTHLDIAHQVKMMDLLSKLNRESGKTILMILHDLNLAAEYCRRLVLMHAGRVRKTGNAEEVLDLSVLEEVYGTPVVTGKNPVSLRPFVLALPATKK